MRGNRTYPNGVTPNADRHRLQECPQKREGQARQGFQAGRRKRPVPFGETRRKALEHMVLYRNTLRNNRATDTQKTAQQTGQKNTDFVARNCAESCVEINLILAAECNPKTHAVYPKKVTCFSKLGRVLLKLYGPPENYGYTLAEDGSKVWQEDCVNNPVFTRWEHQLRLVSKLKTNGRKTLKHCRQSRTNL